ncbi:hypothetical protein Ancab_024284 [Ancistrocladus abbreviatus]
MSLITEDIRAKAIIYCGEKVCQEQTQRLLRDAGLPNGLLPLKDYVECGYVEETGFVWLRQKKKTEHKFEKIGKVVSFATEVTAYAEHGRMKNITGVKAKELLLWITISDMTVPNYPQCDNVTFWSKTGLSRSFPAQAFMVEEKDGKDKKQSK